MQNHDEKITDVIRSVLPSTARRDARRTRQLIHRAARRKVKVALRAGDVDAFVDIRGPIEDMVWDRRVGDKVGPLVRWALHQVGHDRRLREANLAERIDHFRQLLPGSTIGRHALSHIAWPLERLDSEPRAFRDWPSCVDTVRALYETGYHGELNARLKTQQLPLLDGTHDIDSFAAKAGTITRSMLTPSPPRLVFGRRSQRRRSNVSRDRSPPAVARSQARQSSVVA